MYFQTLNTNGVPEYILVAAKTKVTLLNTQLVPRLNLMTVVLGARLSQLVKKHHTLRITRKVLWSDLATVLSWLWADYRRYKQFIARRIGELQTITELSNWRWMASKHNPADIATKWENDPVLSANSVWFKCLTFLRLPQTEWRKEKCLTNILKMNYVPVTHTVMTIPERLVVIERFSQLTRALPT